MERRSQGWRDAAAGREMNGSGFLRVRVELTVRPGACPSAANREAHVSGRRSWKPCCSREWPGWCFDYGGAFANRTDLGKVK